MKKPNWVFEILFRYLFFQSITLVVKLKSVVKQTDINFSAFIS